MNDTLKQFTWANEYQNYLEPRNKGIKKKAQESLRVFLDDFIAQPKVVRRNFMHCVYETAFQSQSYNSYIPNDLSKLFESEIKDWINDEPKNPNAYKWTFEFEPLKIAIELSPFDQAIIFLLVNLVINEVSLNQHEIPEYSYDGNPLEDLGKIELAISYVDHIEDERMRFMFRAQLTSLKECAMKYLK